MNKALKIILNILITVAALLFFVCLIDMFGSIKYAHREVEDPAERYAGVFEYELKHRAYGEVMSDYYVRRLSSMTPQPGYENLYKVAEYAHTAFMVRVMEEKGDAEKAASLSAKAEGLREALGAYAYTADEVDEMLQNAP